MKLLVGMLLVMFAITGCNGESGSQDETIEQLIADIEPLVDSISYVNGLKECLGDFLNEKAGNGKKISESSDKKEIIKGLKGIIEKVREELRVADENELEKIKNQAKDEIKQWEDTLNECKDGLNALRLKILLIKILIKIQEEALSSS